MKLPVIWRSVLFVVLSACAISVHAHDRSESFSEWTWRGNELHFTFSVLQREVTRIPQEISDEISLGDRLAIYLAQQITVESAAEQCVIDEPPRALPSRKGFLYVEGSFDCPNEQPPTLTINSFFDLLATHTHYAKVRRQGQVEEFLLTRDKRTQRFTTPGSVGEITQSGWSAFAQYIDIGARHILSGYDHLAFLFGLILLAQGWKEMAWLITGFTLGHSVSLALAVLGFAVPNPMMVEALIGFTIVLVAVEAGGERSRQPSRVAAWLFILCLLMSAPLWWATLQWKLVLGTLGAGLFSLCYLRLVNSSGNPAIFRLLVTSLFGVIHGFGFAGGLLESEFSAANVAYVLVGFNLGVELGQLVVLLGVIVLLFALRRLAPVPWLTRGANVTVTVLSGLGTFWFVSRLFG